MGRMMRSHGASVATNRMLVLGQMDRLLRPQ